MLFYLGSVIASAASTITWGIAFEKRIKRYGYKKKENDESNDTLLFNLVRTAFLWGCPIVNSLFAGFVILMGDKILEFAIQSDIKKGALVKIEDSQELNLEQSGVGEVLSKESFSANNSFGLKDKAPNAEVSATDKLRETLLMAGVVMPDDRGPISGRKGR